jgi:hypothetical protein
MLSNPDNWLHLFLRHRKPTKAPVSAQLFAESPICVKSVSDADETEENGGGAGS